MKLKDIKIGIPVRDRNFPGIRGVVSRVKIDVIVWGGRRFTYNPDQLEPIEGTDDVTESDSPNDTEQRGHERNTTGGN